MKKKMIEIIKKNEKIKVKCLKEIMIKHEGLSSQEWLVLLDQCLTDYTIYANAEMELYVNNEKTA